MNVEQVAQRLVEIWNSDYINSLPSLIKERNYAFADNRQKDILITGFNPSFREGESKDVKYGPSKKHWESETHDNYFSPIRKILCGNNIDLRTQADYLDIFYFREREQNFLHSELLSKPEGMQFVVDQLNLTMHIIEDIVKPKLIVVKNKESWAYFGKYAQEKGWVWMGYTFEPICSLPCGELHKISGLVDSTERIAPEITQTGLVGTFVLFTKHINQYTKIEERPTPELLYHLLQWKVAEDFVRSQSITML
ncbi:hypothetical protein [Porphyromonas gulae]|uniref:Uncharacterized protein n=1 Tax=Porphyromonas gulae TaxID=111105 RepID=A0A0A2FBJ2_9PORP|nr:hypothetical protein [Porphyromonas gulae]KGN88386.1 hypothetical protein HR15_05215 [Porphyromonas gulae]